MMCEGFTLEDVLAFHAANIAQHGFAVVTVADDEGGACAAAGWAYTVGLLDNADHPELIVAGVSTAHAATLLDVVGTRVLDGALVRAGAVVDLGAGKAQVGAVHPVQYGLDTFAVWHELRQAGVLHATDLEARQVFAPEDWFCSGHRHAQPVLAMSEGRVGGPRRFRRRRPGPGRSSRSR